MIKVLTDTTASLTRAEFNETGIIPIPLHIREENRTYRDLFDLSPNDFYRRQREGARFTTMHPEPEAFMDFFRPITAAGDEVLCILLSGKISPSVAAASRAVEILDSPSITVVDSRQSGYGQARMAILAKHMADTGATRQDIADALEDLRERTHTFFILESLDHLKTGGRFFWDQALKAAMQRLKPIIWFDARGKMKIHNRINSAKEVRQRILRLVEDYAKRGVEHVALHYADNYGEAKEYAEEIAAVVGAPVPLVRLSPVVGAHTGPDVIGPCIITKK